MQEVFVVKLENEKRNALELNELYSKLNQELVKKENSIDELKSELVKNSNGYIEIVDKFQAESHAKDEEINLLCETLKQSKDLEEKLQEEIRVMLHQTGYENKKFVINTMRQKYSLIK